MRLGRLLSCGALAAGTACAPAVASAATPSSASRSGVQPTAERTLTLGARRDPGPQGLRSGRPAEGPRAPVPQIAIRGPRLSDAVRVRIQARLESRVGADLQRVKTLRAEAIDLLARFIVDAPTDAREMPEALVRLGELRWEDEREGFVARFQTWEKAPLEKRGSAPTLDYRPARDLFGRVLRDYPWFEQTDLALYVDGFLAFEQGKEEEARERFGSILRSYPRSRFVPEAHMATAEALFDASSDYAGALAEYEKVLSYKGTIDGSLYGLALFKSAWCYWRLGKNEEAARRFVGVFEATGESGQKKSATDQRDLGELQEEALKYVVEVFSEDEKNSAQDLFDFLAKIGGQRLSGRIVRALAERFFVEAHYERGIEAYELLLKLEPTSPDAGRWILQIASGYLETEDWPHLKATFDRALSRYTNDGPWALTQKDPLQVSQTTEEIEKALREDARALHARAQRDKTSAAEFGAAASLYEAYLNKFGSKPEAYQVHFDLAEIDFFRLGRNVDAAIHYMAAARGIPAKDKQGPLATLRHDALYNALAALSRQMDSKSLHTRDSEGVEAPAGSAADAAATRVADAYAEALSLYAETYPSDPDLPAMFYRQGRHYFDSGHYDAAVKIWGLLIEEFPASEPSREAGDSVLESFSRSKNYENIETWARRLKALPSFAAVKQRERLDALIVVAVFKQGEQKAAAGDHAAAAAAYLRAATEFPNDPRAAQACVNAEQQARLSGDVKTLKESAELAMGPRYADKPESPTGAWIATTTLQAMGLFGDAATVAERMANLGDRDHPNYTKYEHEKDAAYNSVVLREATGEHERAIADGNRFLSTFGGSAEADEVVFQMGRASQNGGRPKDAADLYGKYLLHAKNLDHRAEGYVLLAEVDVKLGKDRAAAAALEEAVALGKKRSRELGLGGRYAAAHARYMQGERVLAHFEQIRIQGDVKQLKARLKEKTELLKEAAKSFLDCVSMAVAEWTTAALYQIGHMYEAYGKSLRDSPPPPEVRSDEQRAEYQAQIEEFAVPMEERSIDAYENGWKKAMDLGIYNQWTARMRQALGRLNTELYPPLKETGFEVRSQGRLPLPPLLDGPVVATPGPTPAARAQ